MPNLLFDVYPPEDPAGKISGYGIAAIQATFSLATNLVDAEYTAELFGPGEGWLEVHIDEPDAQYLVSRAYVLVRHDGDPGVSSIGGFWLEKGTVRVLGAGEQVSRVIRWEGRGPAQGLDRYNLGHTVYATGQTKRGDVQVPGKWRWNDEPYGAMLVRVLEEGYDHPAGFYEFYDWTFTRSQDSNGNAWNAITDYETPIGTSGLKLWADFLRLGMVADVLPELTINAYRDLDEYRTDRSSGSFGVGKVRFEAGVNIVADLIKQLNADSQRTHVIIEDRTGDFQTVDEDLDGNPIDGVPYMTSLKSTTTADDDAIILMGQMHLTYRDQFVNVAKVRHLIGPGGTDGEEGYTPGPNGDYWLGDLVTVHTGTTELDYDETTIEVAAIRFYVQGADWMVEAELGAQYRTFSQQNFQGQIAQTIIQQAAASLQLCTPTIVEAPPDIVVEAEDWYEAGGGASVTGTLPMGYATGEYIAIALGFYHGGIAGGDGIPDPPAGWTAIGSGGFAGGALSGIGFHGSWRKLIPGDTSIGSWATPITGVKLIIFSGMDTADPLGTLGASTQPSGQISIATITPEVTDGTSRFYMVGIHESENIQDNTVSGTQAVTPLATVLGGLGASWLTDPVAAWGTHTLNCANDDRGGSVWELRAGASPLILPGAGREELVGTSLQAKRCDDTEHWHETGSGSPAVTDDVDAGFRVGTIWVNDDGEAWLLIDATAGAADWLAIGGGGGGAPTTADYLVGTAQGGLSAEIVVGTSPGGELGGTWASPTVDATHSGSAHHTANSVRKNSAGSTFTRSRLNLIEGSNVTLTVADDGANDEVDVTIASSGGGSGIEVEEDGSSEGTGITILDFTTGLNVSVSGAQATISADSSGGIPSGTSFPGSPTADDLFYRTDRNLIYFWDGAQWLTVNEYDFGIGMAEAALPASATLTMHRWPVRSDFGIYLVRWVATSFQTNGTPGSNNMTVVLARTNAGNTPTTIASFVTSGDTASNWVQHDQAINAVLDSSARHLRTIATEAGTVTGFLCAETIVYRLIG